MDDFDEKLRHMAKQEQSTPPSDFHIRVEDTLAALPELPDQKHKKFLFFPAQIRSAAACLAVLLFLILPNISTTYAQALSQIPILGSLIQVVTVRNYFYAEDQSELDVQVPELQDSTGSAGTKQINMDVESLTQTLMDEFYHDLDDYGAQTPGALKIDYEILTNTPRWFTLKVRIQNIQGSSNTYFKYYHMDRNTGKTADLGSLFRDDQYKEVLETQIRQQMALEMEQDPEKIYWLDREDFGGDFVEINADHNFYFDTQGNLVIPFDKYEVGPGSIGCPEFTISLNLLEPLLAEP